jgi:hypothetical protein
MVNYFKKIHDYIHPMCPSGLNHRVRFAIVTNCNGNDFCFHDDCWKANTADVETHVHKYTSVGMIYNKEHLRCQCGRQITRNNYE